MSELQFCRQFLSALDSRPVKLSSDHIADARQYPAQAAFTLPRLPHPPHPQRPNPKSTLSASAADNAAQTISVTLKPMKSTSPTVPLSSIDPSKTSIFDLKSSYASNSGLPAAKIKILYKKKPAVDSKTVAEVIGQDARDSVEFSVMVMAGATATPVTSPPVVAPLTEAEKGLGVESGLAVQGPSGKEVVVDDEFWEDLSGFIVQRIRDEKEGRRLVDVFRQAWEKER
ncbi:hypothetical protein CC78DRAFT_464777 [Lojkania enalia]|uniref:Ubiquitin-like domain-containing protein n=1 Tax=Lojkania enalia TaxID=147567 RepID=A0A9P4KCC6_9PLEO|nr:hypothetical protein CC78DRAFT_464777 [Didymosphaeria enalia]